MPDLVSLDVIKAAADRIRGVAKLTPLLKVQLLFWASQATILTSKEIVLLAHLHSHI